MQQRDEPTFVTVQARVHGRDVRYWEILWRNQVYVICRGDDEQWHLHRLQRGDSMESLLPKTGEWARPSERDARETFNQFLEATRMFTDAR